MSSKQRKTDQKRRRFSREFKLDAIKLVEAGGLTGNEVNDHLGLGPNVVQRWMRERAEDEKEAFPGVGQPKASHQEVYELRRQLKAAEEERDILKKALAIFSTGRT